ncbi:hypothetical protein [Streptomyces dysideae]|uniref:hypothetical protein n=1 Tax=Streptomyces dysideae TaxID=909626 RepID=UPI000A613FD0|nr:hypothetical protein [Streptomyces dysideae]
MAITQLPKESLVRGQQISCVICSTALSLDKATAGLQDETGLQAFACNEHLKESDSLILGWAEYIVRCEHKMIARQFEEEYGEGANAFNLR